MHPWVFTIALPLLLLATLLWVLSVHLRYAADYESLLANLDQPFEAFVRLPDDRSETELRREHDAALWRNINGWRGLRRLYRNSGILLTLRLRLERDIGCADSDQRSRGCDEVIVLRLTLLGSLIEALLIRKFSAAPMPRLFLRSAIDQYVEMRSYVRAALEHVQPELVSRFDTVV